MALDARRNDLAMVRVSMGTLTQCMAHPWEVCRVAFLADAAAVIVAYNRHQDRRCGWHGRRQRQALGEPPCSACLQEV